MEFTFVTYFFFSVFCMYCCFRRRSSSSFFFFLHNNSLWTVPESKQPEVKQFKCFFSLSLLLSFGSFLLYIFDSLYTCVLCSQRLSYCYFYLKISFFFSFSLSISKQFISIPIVMCSGVGCIQQSLAWSLSLGQCFVVSLTTFVCITHIHNQNSDLHLCQTLNSALSLFLSH